MRLTAVQCNAPAPPIKSRPLPHFRAQQHNDSIELGPNSLVDIPQEQQVLAWAAQIFKDPQTVRRDDQTLRQELAKLRIADLERSPEYEQYRLKIKTQLLQSFIVHALAQLNTLIHTKQKTGFQQAFSLLTQAIEAQHPPHIMQKLIQQSIEKLDPLIPKALNYEQIRIQQALKLLREAVAPTEAGEQNVLLWTAGKEAYKLFAYSGLIEEVPSRCPKCLQSIWLPIAKRLFPFEIRLTEQAKKQLFKQS